MALFLAHGKLLYTFNVADQRVKIKSEQKYNDGAWHNVSPVRSACTPRRTRVRLRVNTFYSDNLLSSPAQGYFYP